MKIRNLLLTTTALVSAVCMQSALAHKSEPKQVLPRVIHAQTPMHLHIDGLFDVQAGFRSQPRRFLEDERGVRVGVSKYNRDVAFDAAGALTVEGKGKTEKGLEYGARVSVLTTVLSIQNNRFFRNHQAVLYMNDMDMGRLEFGTDFGAFEAMLPTADRVAAATGGIAGDWYKYIQPSSPSANDPSDINNPRSSSTVAGTVTTFSDFYAGPGSLLDNGTFIASDIQKAMKATYYTPKLKDTGLRFGISYIPDTDHSAPYNLVQSGSSNNKLLPNRTAVRAWDKGFQNGIQAAIEWKHKWNKDNKCKIAIVGERADLPRPISSDYNRVGTIGLGASHMYKDFSVAASYVHLGRSGLVRRTADDGSRVGRNNYIATLGLGYMFDNKTKVSVTGLMSEKARNQFHNISVGAEYKLAQGLMPYAELTYFEMRQRYENTARTYVADPSTVKVGDGKATFRRNNGKNRGAAFIIGTRVQF